MLNFSIFRYKKISDISTGYGFRVNSFFFSLKWNICFDGDLERTFILTYDESGCHPPKSELLIEQPNFYILYVDVRGEGGASVAPVSHGRVSWSCLLDSGGGARR